MNKKLSRAFISVSDKTALIEFAKKLLESGVEIIASDGTALELEKFGIKVKRVEEITGFAQILDGKVKTLHPSIYAAVLADLDDANQLAELEKHKITPIDLVVGNIEVGGQVTGDLSSDRIYLNNTAKVKGKLFHRNLVVDEGAQLEIAASTRKKITTSNKE